MKKIIAIIGPTASGKSDLAVEIARGLNAKQVQKKAGIDGAEIISADSRQVYRGMNIGTGKITDQEMRGIPHHLLDVADPKRRFTVARYRQMTLKILKVIYKKNKLPIICGGTGFYIQAIIDGLIIPEVKPNNQLRAQLEKLDTEALFEKLKQLDPRRAKKIDRYNRRRLIRALEIVMITGRKIPPLKSTPEFKPLIVGIKKNKEELKKLIAKRLTKRLRSGLIQEVKKLRKAGISWKRLEEFGLEYRWLALYLQEKVSYLEMVKSLQKDIEQYAKRQMTWFKKDKRIHWVKNKKEAINLASRFIN